MMAQRIGRGSVTSGSQCQGTLRVVETVADVLALMKTELSDVVLFTRSASATALTPLFAKIKGVICTSGGATSHLAIVAREFDLPCVMGCELAFDGELDRRQVAINSEGEVFLDS